MVALINIIGAGNLGKTMGHLLVNLSWVRMGAVVNSTQLSSKQAIAFIGSGTYCHAISALPSADLTLIATPDALIPTVCEALSENQGLKPGHLVVHCSGSLNSDALISAKEKGCLVASIHPMRSFAQPELSVREYAGTYCALEGDVEAIPILSRLFESIGSIVYTIHPSKKALYHAAGVFASNYLVTLSQQALACMGEAGLDDQMAMPAIIGLMQSTLSNLKSSLSPEKSLTGPIKRADIPTVERHMTVLDGERKYLYSILGKATLRLTRHDKEKKERLLDALTGRRVHDP